MRGKHYYFAKVTQVDGNLLWSAPIWLTVAEPSVSLRVSYLPDRLGWQSC